MKRVLTCFFLASITITLISCSSKNQENPGSPGNMNISADSADSADKFGIQEAHYSIWNTGIYYPEGTIDQAVTMFDNLDQLSIKNFRYTIFWYFTERNNHGEYDWSRHDRLISRLLSKGIELSILIGDANAYYDSLERPPYPAHPVAGYHQAWLNFIAAAVTRYGDRVSKWEIWNEEDSSTMWGKPAKKIAPDPVNYTALLAATVQKIREIQPNAFIIMGGVTPFPEIAGEYYGSRKFLKDCFDLGALNHVNAVGIHPYRSKPEGPFDIEFGGSPNETSIENEIVYLKNLIAGYKPGVTLWNTESGYISAADNPYAQMKYLTRSMLIEYAAGMGGLTHFRLRVNTLQPEFRGLIEESPSIVKRPAFNAFAVLSKMIGPKSVIYQQSIKKNIESGESIRIEVYRKNNQPLAAYWFPEDLDNTDNSSKPVRYKKVKIEGISGSSFIVYNILNGTTLPAGACEQQADGVLFSALPVTDYPFILCVN